MMNSPEELDEAADAFSDRYLLINSVYTSKSDAAAADSQQQQQLQGAATAKDQVAVGMSEQSLAVVSDGGAADALQLPRDQEYAGSVAGTATSTTNHQPQRRTSWFGGKVDSGDMVVQKSAGWFKQCRCVFLW